MNQPSSALHLYNAHKTSSRAFLARAESLLSHFDSSKDPSKFFYSALELRFGIEARLQEYLDATLRSLGHPTGRTTEYVASKLLKRLISLNPNAGRQTRIRIDSDNQTTSLKYEPVSPKLASLHGQLGELLHYKFFVNNETWYVGSDGTSTARKSLDDFRQLLEEVRQELRTSLSGTLLTTPFFRALVVEALEDEEPRQTDA